MLRGPMPPWFLLPCKITKVVAGMYNKMDTTDSVLYGGKHFLDYYSWAEDHG